MCAYYEDQTTKIRKNDRAIYNNKIIEIISVKHIKSNKRMDIEYRLNENTEKFNIPYHAFVKGLKAEKSVENA